ncbi:MAG: hypothetical protein FJX44_09270 [Alphaproteobacteria bacterium]|nr:hypothetical protein [Alphaproteobacteria bacterium]
MRQRLSLVTRPTRSYKRKHERGRYVTVRCRRALLRQIDQWRREQKDLPSRPEAMRRLVERAIKGTKSGIIIVHSGPYSQNGKMRGNGNGHGHERGHGRLM